MERYLIRVRAWLLCIVAAVLGACQTATGGFDSLGSKPIEPVSAQTSLERGAAAVKRERWDEAVAHFGNAYRRNPYNPIVQFNYGLANAKAGNELVAIALFDTFIAAVPNAANRPRIERQIERLETAAEGKIARLFDLSEESIRKLPDGPIAQYDLSQRKWDLFHLIAWTQFEAGDQARARRNLATALRMVRAADPEAEQIDRQQIEWDRESYARESRNFGTGKFHWLYTIGNMQAEAEDFDAAFATLQKMADDHMSRREVQGSIFWRKISQTIAAGDLDGALRLSKPGSWKVALPVPKRTYFLYEYAASELSEALIKAGRVAEAMMLERSIAVSDRDSFLAGQIDDLFRAGYGKVRRLGDNRRPSFVLRKRAISA